MILKCRLRRAALLLAVAGIAAVAAPGHDAFAREFKVGAVTVETPWSRATLGGAEVAAGYLAIKNDAATPDRLVSVTADIAGRAGIHQMSTADGMMKMRELTDGLPIPPEGLVTLEPASYHLMFQDLKRPLKEGETFPATLTFERAGTVSVTFEVRGMGAAAPDQADHQHH
jgi:periplasmic copper chaperone A